MAIALVSNATASGANGGTTAGIDTSGATLLVARITAASGAGTVTDSKSNTWVALTSANGSTPDETIYYVANPTVGSSHTFTVSGAASFSVIDALAFSGVATTTPFDAENTAAGGGFDNTNAKPGSITPSENNELIVCGFAFDTTQTMTIDSSMTIVSQTPLAGGLNYGGAVAYKVQTTAAAINPLWGFSGTTAGGVSIASFKAAAGVAFIPRRSLPILQAIARSNSW